MKKKVLIVEDETIIALDLKYELESYGFSVLEPVATGEEALQLIQHETLNLILLDIRLAGKLTGLDVAHSLHNDHHSSLIIFMTGYVTPEIRTEALSLQPLGFLEKPVGVDEVLRTMKSSH